MHLRDRFSETDLPIVVRLHSGTCLSAVDRVLSAYIYGSLWLWWLKSISTIFVLSDRKNFPIRGRTQIEMKKYLIHRRGSLTFLNFIFCQFMWLMHRKYQYIYIDNWNVVLSDIVRFLYSVLYIRKNTLVCVVVVLIIFLSFILFSCMNGAWLNLFGID